jgi:cysteine desulfurase
MKGIYLDHAATTPLHPEVLEAMLPYYRESFGNPSSMHAFGQVAKKAIDRARATIADRLGCRTNELIFTSGGTESNNNAIFGAMSAAGGKQHLITTRIEHHAVLHPCEQLEKLGSEATYLEPDDTGLIAPEQIEKAIRPDTALISIMFGNNEVGTLQPIDAIGKVARSRGIAFHVDAVQALGKVDMNLSDLPVDLMSFSAHKINGPKGIGALYVSGKQRLAPLLYGGSQERKRRPGTENVAGIAAFAKAVELAFEERTNRCEQTERLRSAMLGGLINHLGAEAFVVNGHQTLRLPHILNVSFPGTDSETLLMNLDIAGIAASSGSACTSGSLEVSHVLQAMRLPESVIHAAIRFSFGMGNSMEEIETAAKKIATIVKRIRK